MSDNQTIDDIREQKMEELQNDTDGTEESNEAPSEPIQIGSASELEETAEQYDVVLTDFYADWCGPCKMIAPVVEEIAAETDAAVAKVDVDANQQLATQYRVQGVPTLLLFADGEAVEQIVGAQTKDRLVSLIEQHL